MRLLAWNIQHGGGPSRFPRIVLALLEAQADVVALCEYRARRGGQLRALLSDHGYICQHGSDAAPTDNAVLLASRFPMTPGPDLDLAPHLRRRWATAIVQSPVVPVAVAMVHVPDDTRPSDKAAFWQALCAYAKLHQDRPTVILGDFNTARREDIRSGFRTRCDAMIGQLAAFGYADAHSVSTSSEQPHATRARPISWKGPLNQAARIDAAYLSRSLRPCVAACAYLGLEDSGESGSPCNAGAFAGSDRSDEDAHPSDHAILTVDLKVDANAFPHELG